ncbi:hypothetical protein [Nocardia bovistercoris]|uniref:DUF8020 domain-containing protein n=1 Tax=Nocardia bovistercoris TaxID=2785916 RepID=A0A931IE32_9NOCA|nr:hypothetical protein [Nocardia bovistercoris]MBH0778843.1 hypothetical protein [Nocardia bovistercoris]
MKFKRFAVTALLAAVSTAVVAGTAAGAPTDTRPGSELSAAAIEQTRGTESGVDYAVSHSTDGTYALDVAVHGGRFILNDRVLNISNDSGQLIGQVPLTLRLADRIVSFTARITDSDRAVSITSAGPAEIAAEPLTSEQRIYCWNATLGTSIGMVVGALLGFPLLMPGVLAGAIIGGLVGAGMALNAPMPGMSPTDDLVTKYIRCQQGMNPYGG